MEELTGENTAHNKTFRLEDGLYLLAFGLALLVRLVLLDHPMLTEHEAGYTWQAYQVSKGQTVGLANHPAYVLVTGLMFFVLGAGEVMARLLPALVGSAVILFPYLLRLRLGQKAALIAAFGLALDPLLVAYSRQAGSPMMALGFLALAGFFWQRKRPLTAGVFAGLLLLSGLSLVFGLLVMLVVWGLYSLVGGYRIPLSFERAEVRAAAIGMLVGLAVFGTLFMLYPQGLSFMLQAFPDYFGAWFGGGAVVQRVPMVQVLLALAVYQPLALLFGFFVFFNKRNFQQPLLVFLMCIFLAALLLAFINPARQVWMLVWGLVPLWMLAGTILGRFLHAPAKQDQVLVWGEAVFFLVLMIYWWLNLAKMSAQYGFYLPPETSLLNFAALDSSSRIYLVRLLVTFLIPVLIGLMTLIIYNGWAGEASLQGTVWGIAVFLVFYLVGAGSGFTADQPEVAGELWVEGPSSGYTEELMRAIEDASLQITGTKDQLDLIYQIDSPLVHWLLRDLPYASYQPVINPNQLPSVILNQNYDFENGSLGQFYSGQQQALRLQRVWDPSQLPPDFDRWLVYRDTPLIKDWVVLWTRVDLFPLYNSTPAE